MSRSRLAAGCPLGALLDCRFGFVFVHRAGQQVAQVYGRLVDPRAGEPLVTHHRAGPAGDGVNVQQVQSLLAFVESFGAGQAVTGHDAFGGGDEHELGAPVEGVVAGVASVGGDLARRRAVDGDPAGTTRHRGRRPSAGACRARSGQAGQSQRDRAHQRAQPRRCRLYSDWLGRRGNRCPDPDGCQAQPPAFIVTAQQDLSCGDTDEPGIRSWAPFAMAAAGSAISHQRPRRGRRGVRRPGATAGRSPRRPPPRSGRVARGRR